MRDRLRFHPLVPTSQRTHTHEGSSLSVRSVRLHGISLSLFTFFARPLPFFRLSRSPFTFISVRDSYLPGSRATSTCILLYKEFKLSINFHRLANRCEKRAFQRTWNLDEPPLSPSIDPRALSRSIELSRDRVNIFFNYSDILSTRWIDHRIMAQSQQFVRIR